MAAAPRRDTRGIVDAPALFARADFRRRLPAPELRRYVELYWLIDWDLSEPYASHVVPHPSVNVVFQRFGAAPPWGEVAGIGLELFTQKLEGRGRVCGVKFRAGGFRPFAPAWPVSEWSGRRVPVAEVLPATDADVDDPGPARRGRAGRGARRVSAGSGRAAGPAGRRGDAGGRPGRRGPDDPAGGAARDGGRALGAFVAAAVRDVCGVGPKWVILRRRIHDALERAEAGGELDWAALAAELGYSDQAHLVRDFTATVGVPPTAYAHAVH